MGAILPPRTLPFGGLELIFLNLLPMRDPSLGGGGLGGGKLNFLDLLHMRDTHTNFQLPASKTDLTYNCSEMGTILPPETLLLGELGGG